MKTVSPLFHETLGFGRPLASQVSCKFWPSLLLISFGRTVVIRGGSIKENNSVRNIQGCRKKQIKKYCEETSVYHHWKHIAEIFSSGVSYKFMLPSWEDASISALSCQGRKLKPFKLLQQATWFSVQTGKIVIYLCNWITKKKANKPFLLPEFDHTINCFPIKFISLLPIKISTAYW